ncbi:transglutaminase-like domain-containing protein [Roseibium alexandrii]|uniref:Transglutaminase-like superfamily protein n=1 Tax=Roseibium alexandrii TaxID=388408 RepID=A0A0M6ZZ55_9HYPH|nr:transglutaminase family protein [Roseibium alexandrii]CTQ67462.1 Transglutaminase-like superfamily protein [Roseibium alexandrii]
MILNLEARLAYRTQQPTDVLLQLEAADLPDQTVVSAHIDFSDISNFARVPAESGLGERIWLRTEGDFRCDYSARLDLNRPHLDISGFGAVPPHLLPGDTVRYLLPSRYCPSDEFQAFVAAEFGHLTGGARIAAIRDWIHSTFSYAPGSSNAQTTALDSFVQRQGVCRDFAHVLITLARASAIPARFVSVYAPGASPPDFHAVAEIYLDGDWHLIDATGMASADSIARIGVGADAADVAFMTSFSPLELVAQSVSVTVSQ